MIPKPFIAKWKDQSPWGTNEQAEQDLIISRTLVEIFSDDFLEENLAFRGGTALHKLYLSPASRYSEDIDMVQIKAGPIKPVLQRIGKCYNAYMHFVVDKPPSKKKFLANLAEKQLNPDFIGDLEGLLRPEIQYDQDCAFEWVTQLIEKIK